MVPNFLLPDSKCSVIHGVRSLTGDDVKKNQLTLDFATATQSRVYQNLHLQ